MGLHDWIDLAGLVGVLTAGFGGVWLAWHLAHRDSRDTELAKQGDKINRHETEIRHIQQESSINPFDPKWDR